MEEFTQEEKKLIQPFFTNLDKPVFALINLPEVVKGALFSRYSRTDKSLRRTLLDEFIKVPEIGLNEIIGFQIKSGVDQIVAIHKAEEFYDRILVGFGDDSVAELGGAHLAVESISNIATKVIEDSRIGISPLEKSSRYVYFDKKVDGRYQFLLDQEIMNSRFADLYLKINNLLFDTYVGMIEPMNKFILEKFPMEDGVTERAYKSTIRAKVCDTIRVLLPASTLTNVGLFGNGRAFEYLMTKMNAHPLSEIRNVSVMMHEELSKVIPSFVKRAGPLDEYGQKTKKYIATTRETMTDVAKNILKNIRPTEAEPVTLVSYDKEAENKIAAACLYPFSDLPMNQLSEIVKRMSEEEKRKIIEEYVKRRDNRRHRPGRAFENVYYCFDILGNYGIFRDLHRHRILTQERQLLTTEHGYDTPQEIIDAGLVRELREAMEEAREAYETISKTMPLHAQYVVPMGYRLRWYMTMNLREVFHLTELRTGRQGHPYYRRIAQLMFLKVKEVHPFLAQHLKFIDMNTYGLERLESEKKIDKKLEEIKRKYGA